MKSLNKLYSYQRTGVKKTGNTDDPRNEYQRDYDRIIFSSAFRRLQNKTQVFPLPGTYFVHNRLTHSLEVSSVGRSLGTLIGKHILKNYEKSLNTASKKFYRNHLKNVIAAACLCHDIGNPAFGHSGEDAIASFFKKNKSKFSKLFSKKEYADLINFEGNANSIRVLTGKLNGKPKGGLSLTYSTLAAIAKYPCSSTAKNKKYTHRKKFGFLRADEKTFKKIANETSMVKDKSINDIVYKRHPFVWLVEAADDICYNIIDLEDAHRLKIITTEKCIQLMDDVIRCLGIEDMEVYDKAISKIDDKNEKISFIRAKTINSLIRKTEAIYIDNFEDIIKGEHQTSLFDEVIKQCGAVDDIINFSINNIYNDRSVVEIENAGYNVIYELLDHFVFPALKNKVDLTKSDEKALQLIPSQFKTNENSPYLRVLTVIDYLSGMTDLYATDLYRKIKGIDIGMK